MDRDTLIELGNFLAQHIEFLPPARVEGCDNTFRNTIQWLYAKGRPVEDDLAYLRQHGAHCDCEVLFNAMPYDGDEQEGDSHDDEIN